MGRLKFQPVIGLDKHKCTGCYRCIMVCPVKFCNDASKDKSVDFNGDMCIGCGECIPVCEPKARYGIDDYEQFMTDLKTGANYVAIVPPAIAVSFGGMFLKFNGFLKKLGVKAIFDVSFGAELTVKSYLNFKKKKNPPLIIAQPCPTIVAFIEMYHPELLPYLIPVDSPMLHTVKMIKRFYPQYAKHKFVAISPCLSKRREFESTEQKILNVTFKSIQAHMDKTGDKLTNYPEVDYDGPAAERAVLFSSPGGLMRTVERYDKNASNITKKIEGLNEVYHYLEYVNGVMRKGRKPLFPLIDCLACARGCNGGPGTLNQRADHDELLEKIELRNRAAQAYHKTANPLSKFIKNKLERTIDSHWEESLFTRSYINRSHIVSAVYRTPSQEEIKALHIKMLKKNPSDLLNCHACGYESCDQMAMACINGLNRFENCRHYVELQRATLEEKHSNDLIAMLARVHRITQDEISKNINGIASLYERIEKSTTSVSNSYNATDNIVKGIHYIQKTLEQNAKAVSSLNDSSVEGKKRLMQINDLIAGVSEQSEALIDVANIISDVADETNILGMNAAIQAAHAGEGVGKGFAVVAGQIRNLASNSSRQAGEIASRLRNIKALIDSSHTSSNEALSQFEHIVQLADEVQKNEHEIRTAINAQGSQGHSAMMELNNLRENSMKIKKESDELMSSSKTVAKTIDSIKDIH